MLLNRSSFTAQIHPPLFLLENIEMYAGQSVIVRRSWIGVVGLALVSFSSLGCDKKDGGAANGVYGKVTFEGKAVFGSVVFIGSDNKETEGLLDAEGKYTVAELPQGDYKVVVRGMVGGVAPGPKGVAGPKSDAGEASGATPPAKYAAAATSGLTFKRASGKQEHNIALTP